MDCDRTYQILKKNGSSVWLVKEHLPNTAEKWDSAWIVTEHLSNTADKWESARIVTEHVKD
jgi:hypothetical protein